MFNKIIIFLKKGFSVETKILEEIERMSNGAEVRIVDFDDLEKKGLNDADLVITFGGDGTFVKAANLVESPLILGVNANPGRSEGALTSMTLLEIQKLKDIFLGNFDVVKRHRARVTLNGHVLEEHALNEVYVGATSQFHSSRYKIKFKDVEEEHRSSGVIISTGTGSPAWFYSAGGKVFHYEEELLRFIVREPYFGKRIFTPTLLEGHIKKGEKIVLESNRDFGGILAINDATYDFNKGDIVKIGLSDKPLLVIEPK